MRAGNGAKDQGREGSLEGGRSEWAAALNAVLRVREAEVIASGICEASFTE